MPSATSAAAVGIKRTSLPRRAACQTMVGISASSRISAESELKHRERKRVASSSVGSARHIGVAFRLDHQPTPDDEQNDGGTSGLGCLSRYRNHRLGKA